MRLLATAVVVTAILALAGGASAGTIANTSGITINDATTTGYGCPCTIGKATPYPSTIAVSGEPTVTSLKVTLDHVTHTAPDDIDVLLVGPQNQQVLLMSDSGGDAFENRSGGTPMYAITDRTITFDDGAQNSLPDNGGIPNGSYKPTDNPLSPDCLGGDESDGFPAPAPPNAYGTSLSVFNNTSPNGTWSLYVVDDCAGYSGSIGGWCITVNGAAPTTCGAPTAVTVLGLASKAVRGGTAVSWRTTGESQVAGFELFRTTGGRATKVDGALIRAKHAGTARGASYRVIDRGVRGASYRLRLVHLDGSRSWAGRAGS